MFLTRSPDGLSVLTNSEDRKLRIFNIETNEIKQSTKLNKVNQIKEGGTIYDYVWYPKPTMLENENVNLLVNVYKLCFLSYKFILVKYNIYIKYYTLQNFEY